MSIVKRTANDTRKLVLRKLAKRNADTRTEPVDQLQRALAAAKSITISENITALNERMPSDNI